MKLRFARRSKVFGISLKDRGAILPAGHAGDAAFWYDPGTGNWITSTYYMETLPAWLGAFNARKLPDRYLEKPWTLLLPAEQYDAGTADDVPYERPFAGEAKPVFPHNLPALRTPGDYGLLRYTPFGNSLTIDLAMELLRAEGLGRDADPDLLAVSFSSTDYIGHQFGPHSMEVQDCYLRLDRDLATFLDFIDKEIGLRNTLLFLTSDHGAGPNTTLLKEMKIPAGRFSGAAFADTLNAFLAKNYGAGRWVACIENDQVYLDHALVAAGGHDLREMRDKAAAFLGGLPGVAHAVAAHTLNENEFHRPPLSLLQNGFHSRRSGDVMLLPPPAHPDYGPQGATHGSPYPYDTRVPLIFCGWKVQQGRSASPVALTGVAPTVSIWLDMDFPNGCTGKPLQEVLERIE
jgi:hypothetical protein